MNTQLLDRSNPEQQPPINDVEVHATPALTPKEEATFQASVADFYSEGAAPAAPATVVEAEPLDTEATKGVFSRLKHHAKEAGYFATAQILATANVTGERLRRSDAKSNKLRNIVRVGTVAVTAVMPFVTAGVAAAKGIDLSGAHEAFQPTGMGGSRGAHDVAPKNMAFTNNPNTTTPAPAPPYGNLGDVLNNNKPGSPNAHQGAPTPPPAPAPTVKVSPEMIGDTWNMPEYKGPEDSLDSLANEQLETAFEANGLDPKTLNHDQVSALVTAFNKENDITDNTAMNVGEYKMGEFKKQIGEVVAEALTHKAEEAAKPPVPTPQLPEIHAKDLKDAGLDAAKLPKDLNLPDEINLGDGTSHVFAREDLGFTPEQQQELIKLFNAEKMRTALVEYAPKSFYDYTYPADYRDAGLAGTHELRLKYNDGHLLDAEQQKKLQDVYHNILSELLDEAKNKNGKNGNGKNGAGPV